MDVHCGFCGIVVSVPDDQKKVVCNKCGKTIFDLKEFEKKQKNVLDGKEFISEIEKIEECRNKNYVIEKNNSEISKQKKQTKSEILKSKKLIIGVVVTITFLLATVLILYPTIIKPMQDCKFAENCAENGDYEVAIYLLQDVDTKRGHEMMEEYIMTWLMLGNMMNLIIFLRIYFIAITPLMIKRLWL